jgi:hypothetical protein
LLGNNNEESLKLKSLLFGVIKFVGELFRRHILGESIIFDIIDALLSKEANDVTVEGAVLLIENIGHILDKRLSSLL